MYNDYFEAKKSTLFADYHVVYGKGSVKIPCQSDMSTYPSSNPVTQYMELAPTDSGGAISIYWLTGFLAEYCYNYK